MFYFLLISFISLGFSQDPFEGYVLYTPGGSGTGEVTTYLMDVDNSIVNTWYHNTGAASMPYLIPGDEPCFENTLLYYPCQVNNPTMQNEFRDPKLKFRNPTMKSTPYIEVQNSYIEVRKSRDCGSSPTSKSRNLTTRVLEPAPKS